jgi:hypothetical protein
MVSNLGRWKGGRRGGRTPSNHNPLIYYDLRERWKDGGRIIQFTPERAFLIKKGQNGS